MSTVVVINHVTLDGVMPARVPTRTTSDEFTQGGWSTPHVDPMRGAVRAGVANSGSWVVQEWVPADTNHSVGST